ncbi:hypothetical protein BGX28_002915 [Mortierella sp. GBA30]|nr:hypothetical protein BGX28_002915 [Mortierella sp. GBA30]
MGILHIDCMAVDPSDSTFYGITWADDYTDPNQQGPKIPASLPWDKWHAFGAYIVLVKSNANPTDLNNISWSHVAQIDSTNMTLRRGAGSSPDSGTFGCAVGSTGILPHSSRILGSLMHRSACPKESYMTQQEQWLPNTTTLALEHGDNTETLVHLLFPLFPSSSGSKMVIGQLDMDTKQLIPVANLTDPNIGAPTAINYSNKQLIWYKKDTSGPVLSFYPFANIASVMPTPRSINTTSAYNCSRVADTYIGTLQNSIFMACSQELYTDGSNYKDQLLTMDMTKDTALRPGVGLVGYANDMEYFLPVNNATGQTSFALMQKKEQLYSMTLTGSNAGHIQGPLNLVIPQSLGCAPIHLFPPLSSSPPPSSLPDSAGLVIGIVAGIVIVGAAVWYFYRHQGKAPNESTNVIGIDMPQISEYSQSSDYVQASSNKMDPPPANSVHPETGLLAVPRIPAHPASQGSEPTPLARNAYASGVGTNPAYTFQGQMQGLQFSSHPQPTVVTVVEQGIDPPVNSSAG